MSSSSRIIKNTGYLYIKTLVSLFVSLYVTRVVLNTLGSEDFGIYNVVGGAITMLGFFNLSMASTVQRYLNNAQGKKDIQAQKEIYNVAVVFHGVIAILMFLVLWLAQFILFNGVLYITLERINAAHWVYLSLMISTFFTIISVPYDAMINAHEDMLTYSIIGIIDIVIKLIIALAITYMNGDRLIIYSVLMIFIPILTYIMMKIYSVKHYEECKVNIRKFYNKKRAKEILGFAGWNLVGTSSGMIGNYGNNIILNHFFGSVLNAASGIAIQLNGMLSVLSGQFLKALNPVIYKLGGENDSQKMMTYSYIGCKYSYILLSILSIPVIIEAPYVLRLWLVEVPEWTVFFVRWTMIRALIEQLTATLNRSLESSGHIREYNIVVFVFYLLPLVLLTAIYFFFGGEPYWNLYIPIIFMAIIPSVFKLLYCNKYCDFSIKEFFSFVLKQCAIFTLIPSFLGIIITFFFSEGLVRLCITSSVVILAIVFCYIIMLNSNEKVMLQPIFDRVNKIISKKY